MRTESKENLVNSQSPSVNDLNHVVAETAQNFENEFDFVPENILTPTEKRFLLTAERGDCAGVRKLIADYRDQPNELNINCVDPLERSALIAAIENENIELICLLLEEGIQVKDSLLHAISEEYVEAVETLLQWEEEHHEPGTPYSWEAVDRSSSSFTQDITPLILAAHKNNYEILKILLDRGASLPMPHDVR
jgi:transient receptor potential cation channel subfamily C member 4